MKNSRFSEEQMPAILREAGRSSVTQAAKKQKVSEQIIQAWRKRFLRIKPADVRRLRQLRDENVKLGIVQRVFLYPAQVKVIPDAFSSRVTAIGEQRVTSFLPKDHPPHPGEFAAPGGQHAG